MPRFTLILVVLATAALAAPAAAEARFVINRSMAGVKLGMTGPQVRARLGTPTEVTRHGRTRTLSTASARCS